MGHFDVSLCFLPQAMERGKECVPEDAFVVALGSAVAHVDYVVSHATASRIKGEIAASINTASEFTHESHIIVGNCEDTREEVVKLLLSFLCKAEGNENHGKDTLQQCMIFASEKNAVECKIIGSEDIHSVPEVVSKMGSIVFVALKYAQRTCAIIVANQISTNFLASFLGPARCHVWLLISCNEKIENSMAVVQEALAVRDAVRGFCSFALPKTLEQSSVKALLSARAVSDAEAKSLMEWWQLNVESGGFLHSTAEITTGTTNENLINENALLRTTCAELRVRLAEGEEQLNSELDRANRENARLRQLLGEAERNGGRAAVLEQRVLDLEARLAAQRGELRHREKGEDLKRELEATQAAVQSLEQKCAELSEEIKLNVVEFQEREMEWQAEVRQAIDECQQLRDTITTQGSSIDVVREAVNAAQALQEEELDELLGKIRAISAANPSVCHRRVSPRASAVVKADDVLRQPSVRVLSPSVTKDSQHV